MADLPQAQPLEVILGCATSKQVALVLPYCFHDCETPMFLVDTCPGVISSAPFQECLVLLMSYSETLALTHYDAWYDVKNSSSDLNPQVLISCRNPRKDTAVWSSVPLMGNSTLKTGLQACPITDLSYI